MDIRVTLDELQGYIGQGAFIKMEDRCTELLADKELPKNHRVLILDLKTKALAALNRPGEACDACREEAVLMEELFGRDHPHVASVLHNLAMFLGACNKHDQAQHFAEHELAIIQKAAPGTSREADALVNLAEHIYEQSKFAEADVHLLRALELYEQNDGRRSLGVSTCLNNLGRSAENQGDNEKGVKYLEEAASIREELLGVHPDCAFTLLNYGTGLSALEEFEKGAKALAHALAIYDQLGMLETPYAKAARKNLNVCLDALGARPRSSCSCCSF